MTENEETISELNNVYCIFDNNFSSIDISDCSDYGSSDCPLCVKGAVCMNTLEDVEEAIRGKSIYYHR